MDGDDEVDLSLPDVSFDDAKGKPSVPVVLYDDLLGDVWREHREVDAVAEESVAILSFRHP